MDKDIVLLVEDNDEDYMATSRAFKQSGYDLKLVRAENASRAFDFLLSQIDLQESGEKRSLPALILLDLNLPGIDGRDFLLQIKTDERFREVPVVILTTSKDSQDVYYCYSNGANGYQIKTMGFEKFRTSITKMIEYWFDTATIPTKVK